MHKFFQYCKILLLLAIYPQLLFSNDKTYLLVGEISQIDTFTGRSIISINKSPNGHFLTNSNTFVLLNEDNNIILSFTADKIFSDSSHVSISAYFDLEEHTIYAGQKVGVIYPKNTIYEFPDERNSKRFSHKNITNDKDNSNMRLIPSGPFIFGSDVPGTVHYNSPTEKTLTAVQKAKGKKRVRYLNIKSFYIDTYEISRKQFKQFILETGTSAPPLWNVVQEKSLPVHNASYIQAKNYCQWAGKRLPTELEWEKAARGSGLQSEFSSSNQSYALERILVYPTGLLFNPEVCVTKETAQRVKSIHTLTDKNIHGLFGMCGNAAEWTSSWFMPYRGNTKKDVRYGRKYKVIRGGSFELSSRWTKVYARIPGGTPSLNKDYRAGFRCAKDAN